MFRKREILPSNTPCAACKCLRRKCVNDCVFAPYFPPNDPQKFTNVHKVFGASNVSKILSELHPDRREDAVKSLVYEAESRLQDPVYGCVRVIFMLQENLKHVNEQTHSFRMELAMMLRAAAAQDPHQIEMQQIAAHDHQKQLLLQHQLQLHDGAVRFHDVFDGAGNPVTSSGFNQMYADAADHTVHPHTVALGCSSARDPQMQPQLQLQQQQKRQEFS